MRTIARLALALCLAVTSLSAQQTADSIVSKYIARSGGADKIHAVTTLRRIGKFIGGGGFEARILYDSKRTNLVREEFSFGGMVGITAFDGTKGWKVEPWGGRKDVQPVGEDELKGLLEDAMFDDPLFDYQAKGNKVEYLGTDQIEGSDVFKLRVTLASNGDVRTYYIDANAYVPIKYEVKRVIRGADRDFEVTLGDYKPVAGWYLPYVLTIGDKGSPASNRAVQKWESIEANLAMGDAVFAEPAAGTSPVGELLSIAPSAAPTAAVKMAAAPAGPAAPVKVDSETTAGLGARNIGSAAMSGRVAAIAAVADGDRLTVYVGAASGGVWKSTNGGTTYKPIFDDETVQSIGAITIDPTNPKVIWVGSGESWIRNSVSVGDGIYKSTDGGETWKNMGLGNSEHIVKIVVNPADPNTVYACVPGKAFSDSEDRGVYRTKDGGATWTKVLAGGNLSTGCSMMSMDSKDPNTLYAGMWDFRRQGWTFRSGGNGPDAASASGLFKSTDGGATWASLDEKTAKGLPAKPWGRVAVTAAPSDPKIVYAFIEAAAPNNALYRSEDGGATWAKKDRSQNMVWRPFYFANLIVDPKDPNRIFKPDGPLIMSTNGGASFNFVNGGTHGDHHDVWIDPKNTDRLITGDDGGVWYSYDGGDKWWKGANLPISQFYHVSLDMERPFNVYGGLQDNSSWVGASEYPGGITNSQWENMYGGDGFWMFVDTSDPMYIYAEAQGGYIGRVNRKTHEIRDVQPLPGYKEGKLRFNWNTPIHMSPTEKGTVYIGAQFLFRSRDHGQTWARISPDLTTNDPEKQKQEQSGGITVDNSSAEMHTTIYAISESPKDAKVIWVGTDDGNLQLTRDGGKTWTNVVGRITGLPKSAWVSSVEAGHFDAGTVYATFDLHTFGDMHPYAYRSTDYGLTWTTVIPANAPVRGYAHVIKEDLVKRDLLYVGTEFGLWISVDGGQQWSRFKGGQLPSVAVRDIAIHPRDNALVLATHGRGIWIVDDITPLRALTDKNLARTAQIMPAAPIVQKLPANGGWANGDAAFVGPNPSDDAIITYLLPQRHIFGDIALEVRDSTGKLIATLPASNRRGLNRVPWSMRPAPPRIPPAAQAAFAVGPRYLPGKYTVRLVEGSTDATAELRLVPDPRENFTMADRRAQHALANDLAAMLNRMTTVVEQMNAVRAQLGAMAGLLPKDDGLATKLRAGSMTVDSMRMKIVATKEGGEITGEERLREYLAGLYGNVNNYDGKPTQMQVDRAAAIGRELGDVSSAFDAWVKGDLSALNKALVERKMREIQVPRD